MYNVFLLNRGAEESALTCPMMKPRPFERLNPIY